MSNELAIRIAECYSCGGLHEGVLLNDFKTSRAPYTHWFSCPTTEDPVPLVVSCGEDGGPVEISPELLHPVREAARHGRYFMMMCYITDEPESQEPVKLHQLSKDFPSDLYESSIRWTERELRKAGVFPIRPADLPPPSERRPLVNMFNEDP
jgi:hypothetical protein